MKTKQDTGLKYSAAARCPVTAMHELVYFNTYIIYAPRFVFLIFDPREQF